MASLLKKAVCILILAGAGGCTLHTGYMSGSASLSDNNFTYVKREVQGTASAIYIFGFGGYKRSAIVSEAKKNLINNYSLQDNQALVDITVDWKKFMVPPFFIRNRCIVTASIVQFN